MDTPLKTCRKCLKEFPATLEFFYKNSGSKFGVTPRCKACVNQDNAASHAKDLLQTQKRLEHKLRHVVKSIITATLRNLVNASVLLKNVQEMTP